MIAAICAVVFNLPINATAILCDFPSCAIHSLNELTVNSLPIMINATTMLMRPKSNNNSNAVITINLSATGSRKAPNFDVCFNFLAKYPSSQSVIAAKEKIKVPKIFFSDRLSVLSGR